MGRWQARKWIGFLNGDQIFALVQLSSQCRSWGTCAFLVFVKARLRPNCFLCYCIDFKYIWSYSSHKMMICTKIYSLLMMGGVGDERESDIGIYSNTCIMMQKCECVHCGNISFLFIILVMQLHCMNIRGSKSARPIEIKYTKSTPVTSLCSLKENLWETYDALDCSDQHALYVIRLHNHIIMANRCSSVLSNNTFPEKEVRESGHFSWPWSSVSNTELRMFQPVSHMSKSPGLLCCFFLLCRNKTEIFSSFYFNFSLFIFC